MIAPATLDELHRLAAQDVHPARKALEAYDRMVAADRGSRERRHHRTSAQRWTSRALLLVAEGRIPSQTGGSR